MIEFTPETTAEMIEIPLDAWPGNCYAVATAMVEKGLVEGKAEYGIWMGDIAPGSHFAGRPIARHGWIRLPDGQVLDPTRWVFEDVDPYIYVGPDDDYDFGAAKLKESYLGYRGADESQVVEFLDDPENWDEDTYRKIANTPPNVAPYLMAEAYETLISLGYDAWIPIDYREWANL